VRLILASASPRRAELLTSAGFTFEVLPADVDETPRDGEPPEGYTQRVARDKARQVLHTVGDTDLAVLGADTEVVLGCRILGKPVDLDHAKRMLAGLSGTVHDVLTAVVICANRREWVEVVTTRVHFQPLSQRDIDWYVASGEPMGKAGAYAIQGLGARFVDRIEGSWSNVVGLPLHAVHRLLGEVQ
jgi:septum formation protein